MILSLLISFGIFLFTSCPTVYSGDSGELITACGVMGIAHPSGYPLYVLLGKIFTLVIPFGNIAYRVNIMSAFFGAMTCGIVYEIVSRKPEVGSSNDQSPLTAHDSRLSAFIAAMALAFSNQLWSQSTMAEVYSLNGFFVALIIYLLLLPTSSPQANLLGYSFATGEPTRLLPAFLFGLGLGNHHTLLLLIPGILYLAGSRKSEVGSNTTTTPLTTYHLPLTAIITAMALGVSVYLFLVIRSQQNPIADWDNPENITNFFKVVFRTGYGGVMNLDEKSGMLVRPLGLLFSQMADYFKNIAGSFTIFGFILGILGFIFQYRKEKKVFWFLCIIFFFTGPVFIFLANKPLIEVASDQLEPFYIPSIIVFSIWIGSGVKFVVNKSFWTLIFLIPIIFFQFSANFPRNNLRNNFLSLDAGKNILKTAAQNSLLFLDKSDEVIFILAYQQIIERRRPAVGIVDCNASVFPNVYGDRYYWIMGNERRTVRYPVERKMIADHGRKNIYYMSENPNYFSDIKFYNIGLLYSMNERESNYNLPQIYILRKDNLRFRDTIMAYTFYQNLAKYYDSIQQINSAVSMYEQAIRIKPDYVDAYYNLAVLYWNTGNWQGVVAELEKVLQMKPDRDDIRRLLETAKRKL